MRILVTYAVQGEFTELKFPGLIGEEEVQVGYLRTGVGKVKSAFYLSEAISHAQPDLVVNVGTAGTIRHQVGDRITKCTVLPIGITSGNKAETAMETSRMIHPIVATAYLKPN